MGQTWVLNFVTIKECLRKEVGLIEAYHFRDVSHGGLVLGLWVCGKVECGGEEA